ncbi:MAG: RHS repeat-associated core domain-containing protein [Novosphingobium sp.]|nr:RHS repeat-associated core domain-containing protein [Novosphingobium sp.]
MLTNGSKANVWEAVYRPFGEVHAITGTATQNLRFPGQYFLFETGLAHNWHRTYDATIGRYLQADPLGFVDGPSVYSYVRSSPIALVDPLGQRSGSISRRPIWQPSPQSVPNICQQYPTLCGGWIPVAVQILKVCPGIVLEMAGGRGGGGDDCKDKLTEWQVKRLLGLDAHKIKEDSIPSGTRIQQLSRYELCKCKNGDIVVRLNGCNGPIYPTGLRMP